MKKMHKAICLLLTVILTVAMLTVGSVLSASAEDGRSFTAQVGGRWVKGEKQADQGGDPVYRFSNTSLSQNVIFCRVNPAAAEGFDTLEDQWDPDVVWNRSASLIQSGSNVCYLYAIENGVIKTSWANQAREGGYIFAVAQDAVKNDGAVIYVYTTETLLLTEHDPREASYDAESGDIIPGCSTTYYTGDDRYFVADGSGGYTEVTEEELFTLMPAGDQRILGDADADGVLSVVDATAIQRVLASYTVKSFDTTAADVDRDGKVTIMDATFIQRRLVSLPCPEGIGDPIV